MQETRTRGGAVLDYSPRAATVGLSSQEEWSNVLTTGGAEEGEGSCACEPRLPLPGNGAYIQEADQCDDAEDSTRTTAIQEGNKGSITGAS